jgi:hypothetical protein
MNVATANPRATGRAADIGAIAMTIAPTSGRKVMIVRIGMLLMSTSAARQEEV